MAQLFIDGKEIPFDELDRFADTVVDVPLMCDLDVEVVVKRNDGTESRMPRIVGTSIEDVRGWLRLELGLLPSNWLLGGEPCPQLVEQDARAA